MLGHLRIVGCPDPRVRELLQLLQEDLGLPPDEFSDFTWRPLVCIDVAGLRGLQKPSIKVTKRLSRNVADSHDHRNEHRVINSKGSVFSPFPLLGRIDLGRLQCELIGAVGLDYLSIFISVLALILVFF